MIRPLESLRSATEAGKLEVLKDFDTLAYFNFCKKYNIVNTWVETNALVEEFRNAKLKKEEDLCPVCLTLPTTGKELFCDACKREIERLTGEKINDSEISEEEEGDIPEQEEEKEVFVVETLGEL